MKCGQIARDDGDGEEAGDGATESCHESLG